MPGPAPNPDAARRSTHPNSTGTFGWTELPAEGRTEPAPPLPPAPKWLGDYGGWPVATRTAWRDLWQSPQATVWDKTGKTLRGWAQLHAIVEIDGPVPARMAELRQIENLHGLSPAAMLRLRWRIVDKTDADVVAPATKGRAAKQTSRKESIMRLVRDGEATAG